MNNNNKNKKNTKNMKRAIKYFIKKKPIMFSLINSRVY